MRRVYNRQMSQVAHRELRVVPFSPNLLGTLEWGISQHYSLVDTAILSPRSWVLFSQFSTMGNTCPHDRWEVQYRRTQRQDNHERRPTPAISRLTDLLICLFRR